MDLLDGLRVNRTTEAERMHDGIPASSDLPEAATQACAQAIGGRIYIDVHLFAVAGISVNAPNSDVGD
jgi:hypothetical protein